MRLWTLYLIVLAGFLAPLSSWAEDKAAGRREKALLAGGCFWCIEAAYDTLPGVISAVSGYTGGRIKNPKYFAVVTGLTGHAESVEVVFDPEVISYRRILEIFWENIDPTQEGGQFADRGSQYRTAIFYQSEEQRAEAEASRRELQESGRFKRPLVTEILPAEEFYPAEENHQDYHVKNAESYERYAEASGRKAYVRSQRKGNKAVP